MEISNQSKLKFCNILQKCLGKEYLGFNCSKTIMQDQRKKKKKKDKPNILENSNYLKIKTPRQRKEMSLKELKLTRQKS